MRKVRKLGFLGILSVLTVIVFLAGISFMQAQVQAKGKPPDKPGKPPSEPEATWAVRLPTSENAINTMLFGDKFDYNDAEETIEVTVEKNTPGVWRKDNDFVTYIGFKISNPTDRYVNFEGISLLKLKEGDYDWIDPDYGKPCCVFPPPYNCSQGCVCDDCIPLCMQEFMNGANHPYTSSDDSSYRYFLIELRAFDKDILTMYIGESYQLGTYGHYHDYIVMTLRYQTGDRKPLYHNIDCSKSAHLGDESLHPFNIWITRKDDNTWTVDVGIDGKTKEIVDQFLFLEEYYYETIQRGKNTAIDGWYSTLFAGGNFHFTFDLIRTQ